MAHRRELQTALATQAKQLDEARAAVTRLEAQLVMENDDQVNCANATLLPKWI